MADALIQLGIAAFGLSALWMAMGRNALQRKWAPVVGLLGQAFWTAFAWKAQAFGIAVLVAAYTAVYLRGAWVQFAAPSGADAGKRSEGCLKQHTSSHGATATAADQEPSPLSWTSPAPSALSKS